MTEELKRAAENLSEPINAVTTPMATSVGNTLKDLWDCVFGPFHNFAEKKRLSRQKDLDDFENELYDEVNKIPKEDLIEPKISIVGPALEASKYYFEEKEIRDMFAKLIASSMNRKKASTVHPAFTEIIKQMTPLDAQNLSIIFKQIVSPICKYLNLINSSGSLTLQAIELETNIFLENKECTNLKLQSVSIAFLSKMGLIEVSYEQYLEYHDYSKFYTTSLFSQLVSMNKNEKIDIQKGMVTITPLGKDFKSICLDF